MPVGFDRSQVLWRMGQHFGTVLSDGYQVFDPHASAFVVNAGFIGEDHTWAARCGGPFPFYGVGRARFQRKSRSTASAEMTTMAANV